MVAVNAGQRKTLDIAISTFIMVFLGGRRIDTVEHRVSIE